MNKIDKLENHVEIIGGQITSRVIAKVNDEVVETRRVITPSCIQADGTIDFENMPEEQLKVKAEKKRITEKDDIVLKLSSPYIAALIDENSEGCLVPSFCAIIKNKETINNEYLLAFLNSSYCEKQLKKIVAGYHMSILPIGKLKSISIPVPSEQIQREIGQKYIDTQNKIKLFKKIVELEKKRNDIVFKELGE